MLLSRLASPSYRVATGGAAVAALAGAAAYGLSPAPVELHRVERTSVGGTVLTVMQRGDRRWLSLGDTIQSIALVGEDGRATLTHAEEWTQLITVCADAWLRRSADAGASASGPAAGSAAPCALLLGLGGAVIARSLHALHSSLSLHAVELEPEVLDASLGFFELRLDERCSASVADAALFVKEHASHDAGEDVGKGVRLSTAAREKWDVIVVDCFTEMGLAPSVADGRLLRHLAGCLAPGGLCLINTTWSTERGATAREVAARLSAHFDAVYLLEAGACRNVIVLCHQGGALDAAQWGWMFERVLPASMCPDASVAGCLRRLECVGGGGGGGAAR